MMTCLKKRKVWGGEQGWGLLATSEKKKKGLGRKGSGML